MANKSLLYRQALEKSRQKILGERAVKTALLTIDFTTHSADGLNLLEAITAEELKSPHEPVWDWFELWIDYFSEDEGDASWKFTFSESVTRLDLARQIQLEYLETYKENKGTPYLRRLVQRANDPSAFSAEIVQV